MALLLALVGLPFAKSTDLYFFEPSNGVSPCLAKQFMRCASDTAATSLKSFFNSYIHKVRIRIIDAPESDAGEFGIYLERPFLIIDGIHLSTDEQRTLDQFEQDTREFGIPAMLKSLGYTPVLVQFSQTVRRSLTSNAESLVNLMHYLNSNSQLPFPNRAEDGFIALGISQGGIIGRYAAYRYDITRSKTEAPIRLYASLDSPHQGAVMPRGLISTIDFWATEGGVASAEAIAKIERQLAAAEADGDADDIAFFRAKLAKAKAGRGVKDRTYHYLPYRTASAFERTFFAEALRRAELAERDLEIYYNGDSSLTEFRIHCYRRLSVDEGGAWTSVGQYTPDFLVLHRDKASVAIDACLIVETKGELYARDPAFRHRRAFAAGEFLRLNAPRPGAPRFQYLYLEETADWQHQFVDAVKEFFG